MKAHGNLGVVVSYQLKHMGWGVAAGRRGSDWQVISNTAKLIRVVQVLVKERGTWRVTRFGSAPHYAVIRGGIRLAFGG